MQVEVTVDSQLTKICFSMQTARNNSPNSFYNFMSLFTFWVWELKYFFFSSMVSWGTHDNLLAFISTEVGKHSEVGLIYLSDWCFMLYSKNISIIRLWWQETWQCPAENEQQYAGCSQPETLVIVHVNCLILKVSLSYHPVGWGGNSPDKCRGCPRGSVRGLGAGLCGRCWWDRWGGGGGGSLDQRSRTGRPAHELAG